MKRAHPEQDLQAQVATFLKWALPPDVYWTAIGHGGGGRLRGAILKKTGLKKGATDLHLLWKSQAYYIELKKEASRPKRGGKGGLSDDQILTHQRIKLAGGFPATCYSLDDVVKQLKEWGFTLRAHLPPAERAVERAQWLRAAGHPQ